jgi:hypothetical protein
VGGAEQGLPLTPLKDLALPCEVWLALYKYRKREGVGLPHPYLGNSAGDAEWAPRWCAATWASGASTPGLFGGRTHTVAPFTL